jgi:hypothetical protein
VEIAIATQTSPGDWWDETDEVIATALDVLDRNAARIKQASRKRR